MLIWTSGVLLRGSFRDGDYRISLPTLGQIPVQNSRTLIHVLTFLLEASDSMKTSCTLLGFKLARLHYDGTFYSVYEGLMTTCLYVSNIYKAVCECRFVAWVGIKFSSGSSANFPVCIPVFGSFFIVKAVVHIKSC